MPFNKWHGAPDPDDVIFGKYNFHQVWLCNPNTVAAPLTPIEVKGIQNINPGPMTPNVTKKFMQHGGGDAKLIHRSDYEMEVTFNMLTGQVPVFISAIYERTLGATDGYALPMRPHSYPMLTWEAVCRSPEGTHLFSEIFQDLILTPWTISQPMEDGTTDITFLSHHDSFVLYKGARLVIDQFDGDDSTDTFTLSEVPVTLLEASDLQHEDWSLNNAIYVKNKTASQNTGVRLLSGVTITGQSLDVSGNLTPATGDVITCAYATEDV